ncbi:MAG: glycosyltransferase [Solirubrobacterales bacterium]
MRERRGAETPSVVIGVPVFGAGGAQAVEALTSLLAQSEPSVRYVVCDDGGGSRDALAGVLDDPRVTYRHNTARLGLVENWREVFLVGRALYPGASYFAWGSDHDIWDREWLAKLMAALERRPTAVLAYPRVARIAAGGEWVPKDWSLDTTSEASPTGRLRSGYSRMAAGDMVYGLYRARALERCGVFRAVLAPDRLLLAELSLQGSFVQVPDLLWARRYEQRFTIRRQRTSLFGSAPGAAPKGPWWLQHLVVFSRATLFDRAHGLGPGQALGASLLHASLVLRQAARRSIARRVLRARIRIGAAVGRRWRKAAGR